MTTQQMSKIFKALSNPNRLELYFQIVKMQETRFDQSDECFVNDIMDCFKIGAPTISHHLKELSNADLITTERRGKFLVAKVNKELVDEVCRMLSNPANET